MLRRPLPGSLLLASVENVGRLCPLRTELAVEEHLGRCTSCLRASAFGGGGGGLACLRQVKLLSGDSAMLSVTEWGAPTRLTGADCVLHTW